MRRIMGFSYKGGAGRSTAMANIATALAKLGSKVLVIDYDMQAPGLHIIFKASPGDREAGAHPEIPPGIPDYLAGKEPPDAALASHVVNLADVCAEEETRERLRELKGELHFLSGVATRPGQEFEAEHFGDRLAALVDFLEDEGIFDYVCLDSPSGINSRSEHVFDVSQLILIFYRWSTQHVEGTQIIMRYLNEYINEEQLGERTYEIVGNAVPSDRDLELQAKKEDLPILTAYKSRVRQKLTGLLKQQYEIERRIYAGTPFGKLRQEQLKLLEADEASALRYVISEDPKMKLAEFLAVLYSDDTVYERIAKDIVDKKLATPGREVGAAGQ